MVRMIHNDPRTTGGPTAADVPEEGVAMMQSAGWVVDREGNTNKQSGEGEPLQQMTVAELRDLAKDKGIPIPGTIKGKDDLYAFLAAKLEEKGGEGATDKQGGEEQGGDEV